MVFFDDVLNDTFYVRRRLWLDSGSTRPEHWIFTDAGLTTGALLGRTLSPETTAIGYESDGTPFNCEIDGRTISGPLLNSGVPFNYTILAYAPVASLKDKIGFTTLGIYTVPGGGAVFSANTTAWANALVDPRVAQVTRNILDRFVAGDVPPEPASPESGYLFHDRFNCNSLDHAGVLSSYSGPAWYEGAPSHNYLWESEEKPGQYPL